MNPRSLIELAGLSGPPRPPVLVRRPRRRLRGRPVPPCAFALDMSPILIGTLVLAAGAQIEWSKDYTGAFAQAQERGAPLLVHFRGANCGHPSPPGAIDSRGAARGGIARPQ